MAKFYNMTPSRFFCTQCGREGIPVQRKKGQEREGGHLKKLYCLYCKEEVNHVEVRPFGDYNYEDFLEEFKLGRFVNGERVPGCDLLQCSKLECKYNRGGRCWNSNESFDCGHRILKEV